MDSCIKCSIINRIVGSNSDVYISASEAYLLQKIKEILTTANRPFKDLNDVVVLEGLSFKDLVDLLIKDKRLSEAEKHQIQMLPLNSGERLNPQHIFSYRTLKAWSELVDAGDLLEVLQERKIVTYFQAILSSSNVKPYAFECLSRGFKKDGSLIPPLDLFEKAKILELHFSLDRLTREVAIERAANLGIKNHKIFINFLPSAIYNPQDCLLSTLKAVNKHKLKPSNIVFEVVESEHIKDIPHLKSILEFYRAEGFLTALDDFGSGYSSLKMLDELSPDYVKIDMHFIRDVHKNQFKQTVIQAIVNLTKTKGIRTLAEGVETAEEFEAVRQLGVDLVQGYYFSKPSPEIQSLLSK